MLKNKIISELKHIYDPEIPVNIYDLGMIYDINVLDNNNIEILMTFTAPNCPEAENIPIIIENNLRNIPEINEIKINITFDPPWDRSRMSEIAKLELNMF